MKHGKISLNQIEGVLRCAGGFFLFSNQTSIQLKLKRVREARRSLSCFSVSVELCNCKTNSPDTRGLYLERIMHSTVVAHNAHPAEAAGESGKLIPAVPPRNTIEQGEHSRYSVGRTSVIAGG